MAPTDRTPMKMTQKQKKHLIDSMEELGTGFAKNCGKWPDIVKELNAKLDGDHSMDSSQWLIFTQFPGIQGKEDAQLQICGSHLRKRLKKLGPGFSAVAHKWVDIVAELNTKGVEKSCDDWIRKWEVLINQAKRENSHLKVDQRKRILNAIGDQSPLTREQSREVVSQASGRCASGDPVQRLAAPEPQPATSGLQNSQIEALMDSNSKLHDKIDENLQATIRTRQELQQYMQLLGDMNISYSPGTPWAYSPKDDSA